METWSPELINEAIKCRVQFGVLVPGQGSVIGRMVEATPKARMAVIEVTFDPRGWMVGVKFPADMRFIGEIPYPADNFSLMRPANAGAKRVSARAAAKRMIARTKAKVDRDEHLSPVDKARQLEAMLAARGGGGTAERKAAVATPAPAPRRVAAAAMSPLRRRILQTRQA